MYRIAKRNGEKVDFDIVKITTAMKRAFEAPALSIRTMSLTFSL